MILKRKFNRRGFRILFCSLPPPAHNRTIINTSRNNLTSSNYLYIPSVYIWATITTLLYRPLYVIQSTARTTAASSRTNSTRREKSPSPVYNQARIIELREARASNLANKIYPAGISRLLDGHKPTGVLFARAHNVFMDEARRERWPPRRGEYRRISRMPRILRDILSLSLSLSFAHGMRMKPAYSTCGGGYRSALTPDWLAGWRYITLSPIT